MNVLLLNGSPRQHGCTHAALAEIEATLLQEGICCQWLWLGAGPIAGCTACRACRKTGRCFMDDGVNQLLDQADALDGMIVGSPVYYAAAAGGLTSFLDRLFYASAGRFDGKLGASVVSCRRGGASAAFDQLNKYFLISNMPVVPSQYWNQVHGNTPEEVKQDLEGLQTMRTLARNMAWLLKLRQAGEQAGIKKPQREARLSTNFIR